jgi:transcriptional regulator with GAF, ATPase, and Fis domain
MPDEKTQSLNTKLQRLIETVDITNVLTMPLADSIHKLLEVSAADVNSIEASVLVRDGAEGELKFLAAIGSVADQLADVRIPAGKGIAGFVLSSGQPMAVADAGGDETFYAEVDKLTGYSTQTILATPLRFDGEVIGVLEYVNRRGEPPFEPFSPAEMDRAAVYADAIASLVNAYNSAKLLRELSDKVIAADSGLDLTEIRDWLAGLRDSQEHRERMELAVMLRDIAERGEAERKLCRELLDAVLRFSASKDDTGFLRF